MWNKNHLSTYNKAESPLFSVQDNGKVDILNKQGDEKKIGLTPDGMYVLMQAWLQTNHMLDREKRDKLIELLK
ncbi:hypothetical protein BA81_14152 [Bacillus safensis FO-36b]|uniref:hypothetical protein n=1 Tax=Bacillus safensis TaxID=561879 RepID=UPI00045C924D|nr:hypothetical protein [Bacillus safensis]AWI35724.1 hypothetical protein RS87_03110 [Bacillus safensis FO-36b]KDE26696.1 hypothetical protein BA81_14152 [Bacillus safensis FO-36b]MCM3050267.1 hypothetical protein [Bacillus safensis]MEC1048597.1 hypothetical protein [Bacillus safensis]